MPSNANWFSSGILFGTVQAPIAANQVLVDGRLNDQSGPFNEIVQITAAANVPGFISFQLIDVDGVTVVIEQAIQIGNGNVQVEFTVREVPGQHLRIVNKVALTSGGLEVSMIYLN